jgi:hypothetical protein
MVKRLLFIALLALAAVRANAFDYTDVYYNSSEPGWGAFVVQSDTTQFIALFIYKQDGSPTWYTGQLTDDGTGNYAGTLYATTGTFFAAPWQGVNGPTAVGTIAFKPADDYYATIAYEIKDVGSVSKLVMRQPLTANNLAGTYFGAVSGSITDCANKLDNVPDFQGSYTLAVSQVADQTATLTFSFVDANHTGAVCTVKGLLGHFGRLYQMLNATVDCNNIPGSPFSAAVDSLHPTQLGIEGEWVSTGTTTCAVAFRFSAVRDVSN